jgi:hypothetical protein
MTIAGSDVGLRIAESCPLPGCWYGDVGSMESLPTEPERSIMAPRTRKEADVASSSNPPNMDALDGSMSEPDDDTMEDLDVALEEDTKGDIG